MHDLLGSYCQGKKILPIAAEILSYNKDALVPRRTKTVHRIFRLVSAPCKAEYAIGIDRLKNSFITIYTDVINMKLVQGLACSTDFLERAF